MAIGFTCGPDAAIAEYPCMSTLPDKAILAVLAIVLNAMAGDDGDVVSEITCDSCWFAMNDHEKLVALANILLSYAVENRLISDPSEDLTQAASCLAMGTTEEQLKGMILCNLCTVLSNNTLAQ